MSPKLINNVQGINNILKCFRKQVEDKPSIHYKVEYNDGDVGYFNMDVLRLEDPYMVINHA